MVDPTVVFEPPPPPRIHGDPAMRKDLGFVLFVVAALVIGLATWNVAGALAEPGVQPEGESACRGDRLAIASPETLCIR